MARVLLSFLPFAFCLLPSAFISAPPVKLWSVPITDISAIAAPQSGACVAVLKEGEIQVLDRDGALLWSAPLVEPKRAWGSPLAVPGTCDWVAVVGDTETVQILRKSLTPTLVRVISAAQVNDRIHHVRSLDANADGTLLVVGMEPDEIVLFTSDGRQKWRLASGETGQPKEARFSNDGRAIIASRFFSTGVISLAGSWTWRAGTTQVQFREIEPSRDLTASAALYAPMHGVQGGNIAMLNGRGEVRWSRQVFDGSVAIVPDGSAIVASFVTSEPGPVRDPPHTLVVIDRNGRDHATRQHRGMVEAVSADGSCVLLREPANAAGDGNCDLVARDMKLVEHWRIPGAFASTVQPLLTGDRVFVFERDTLSAYALASCRAMGNNH